MCYDDQDYWFVLTKNNLLSFYSDEKKEKLDGQILLDGIYDLKQSDEKKFEF